MRSTVKLYSPEGDTEYFRYRCEGVILNSVMLSRLVGGLLLLSILYYILTQQY